MKLGLEESNQIAEIEPEGELNSEGAAHTHLYGLMWGHGQIYLERESMDMRLEFRIQSFLLSQIFLLLLYISERFLWVKFFTLLSPDTHHRLR